MELMISWVWNKQGFSHSRERDCLWMRFFFSQGEGKRAREKGGRAVFSIFLPCGKGRRETVI